MAMKELSIEDKAKRYDKAIERANSLLSSNQLGNAWIYKLLPELKESEDERIRKIISDILLIDSDDIREILESNNVLMQDIDAWLRKHELEKQGEQKPTIYHKFRIGDEIKTANEESLIITKIDDKGYWSEDLFICDFDEESIWDLVEQKTEWSEEDEKIYNRICDIVHSAAFSDYEVDEDGKECGEYTKITEWFKFLKYRVCCETNCKTRWKPSDAQIASLTIACDRNDRIGFDLTQLLRDLKKLKE